MMTRLKIIICVLLAVILPIINFAPAFAFSQIDLSRIKFSSSEQDLVFRFGGLKVYGKLRQVAPFTEAQISEVIYDTMLKTGVDGADLYDAQNQVERARRHSQITPEQIEQLKEDLYTTMGVVPGGGTFANVIKAIDHYMNSSSWDDVGMASADLLESSLSEWVEDTAKGFVEKKGGEVAEKMLKVNKWRGQIMSIIPFCQMLAEKYAHDKQKFKEIAEGAKAKMLMNEFYQKLQEEVDLAMDKSDKKGWEIDFDSKGGTDWGSYVEREFPFFKVEGNKQTWYLDMHMAQTATNEFGSVLGIYEGNFNMKADHDMSMFASKADVAAKEMEPIKSIIEATESESFMRSEVSLISEGSVHIERTISGSCEAVIDKSGEISLTLNEQNDQTDVEISGIEVEVKITLSNEDLGDLAALTLPFEISSEDESIIARHLQLHVGSIHPDFNIDEMFGGGTKGDAGWDEEIWRHWEGPYADKKLSHVGQQ